MNRSRATRSFGAGVLAFALLFAIAEATALRWNSTGSYPRGLWRIASADWKKGDLVLIDTPVNSTAFTEAQNRGYLRDAYTRSGCAPLLKRVVAVGGDRVDLEPAAVSVNGVALPNSAARHQDSAGRPLPRLELHRQLAPGEILVLSDYSAASYDSRYFGPLSAASVRGRAVPVLTW